MTDSPSIEELFELYHFRNLHGGKPSQFKRRVRRELFFKGTPFRDYVDGLRRVLYSIEENLQQDDVCLTISSEDEKGFTISLISFMGPLSTLRAIPAGEHTRVVMRLHRDTFKTAQEKVSVDHLRVLSREVHDQTLRAALLALYYCAQHLAVSIVQETQRTSKAGRPRNKDDDWAWEQVHLHGRSRAEVFEEWKERIGERVRLLTDSKDSFSKATRKNRRL